VTQLELEIKLLFEMKRIRQYEEGIAARYAEQKMRCPTHLSVGQEAVPAAIGQALTHQDYAVSTHRSHAHYLGKGGSGKKMIAEIYGKETGCAKGRGGSMHLVDLECGFKGSTAIVGNSIPVGVGLGLALKLDGKKNLSCVFLGDAAVEEGAFYEAANFAALKKLPVLFVCENNFYSVYSHLRVRQPEGRQIYKMVEGMGIPSSQHDGNDVSLCYDVLKKAASEIKSGSGPRFLEFITYRWREHCGPNYDNNIGYRTEAEFLEWKKKDPIERQEKKLLTQGALSESKIKDMELAIKKEVDEAFEFAEKSRYPDPSTAFDYMFADENGVHS